MPTSPPQPWSLADAFETYGVRSWGAGYFGINDKGNVDRPRRRTTATRWTSRSWWRRSAAAASACRCCIRFTDVLRHRVVHLNEAFSKAIAEHSYQGSYRGVYPIKVNQHRYVAETIVEAGRQYDYGLEAGSKPELLAVMALLDSPDALVICNGYKDEEYIETALFASRLGRKVMLVVEKPSELPLIAEVARRTGHPPAHRHPGEALSTRGAGKWEASGGDRTKFGLSSSRADGLDRASCARRACSTASSSCTSTSAARSPTSATSRTRCARRAASTSRWRRQGAPLKYLDVGGGLGVDYDGSQTNFTSSMNYTTEEYANDVVFSVHGGLRRGRRGPPHPGLRVRPRGGRAPRGAGDRGAGRQRVRRPASARRAARGRPPVVQQALGDLPRRDAQEPARGLPRRHRVQGGVPHPLLAGPPVARRSAWRRRTSSGRSARRSCASRRELDEMPEELEALERQLSDTYFCNFSRVPVAAGLAGRSTSSSR